jgi:putative sporulation protein YtaF
MCAAILLAFGLSIDGFGVGLSYGLRRIRFTVVSLITIALCTVIVMTTSMTLTNWMAHLLRFVPVSRIGAVVLFYLGGVQLWQVIKKRKANKSTKPIQASALLSVLDKNLSNLLKIIRKPSLADTDFSGIIDLKESILLGGALSLDAFAAGIGAGFSGMNLSVVFLVGVCQIAMINLGRLFTQRLPEQILSKTQYLPGALLITLAIWKLI